MRVVSIISLMVSVSCHAAKMPHYDLASLYWLADVVIEAVEPEYKRVEWHDEGVVEVLVVHKGTVKVGDKIPVVVHTLSRTLPNSAPAVVVIHNDGSTEVKMSPEPTLKSTRTLLFLKWREKEKQYWVTGNGMVFQSDHKTIYGLRQFSNPGPYGPTPFVPIYTQPQKGVFDWQALETELVVAIQHATAFEAALGKKDKKQLMQYLKAPWKISYHETEYFFSQEVARCLIKEHGTKEDLEAALRVTGETNGCPHAQSSLQANLDRLKKTEQK